MFICVYEDDTIGTGATLKAAWDEVNDKVGDSVPPSDCTFYEGEEVSVEVKIERKEVITKIKKA
jgi:hypothetical protein